MLTPDELLGPSGRLAARLAGWESRPQQLEMARLVAEGIRERRHVIVEAGTGTGKSLAYLVPAVLAATADQAESVPAARPTASDAGDPDADWDDEPAAAGPGERPRRVVISTHTIALQEQLIDKDIPLVAAVMPIEIAAWAKHTADGTLSDLPALPSDGVWDEVKSDSGNCMGRACPTHGECF